MPSPSETAVLEALRVVIDPDFRKDIVSLGFVKNLNIKGDHVAFDIELTTPACPVKVEFQRQAEEAVRKVPGVGSVNVVMTSRARKAANQLPGLTGVKNIIAVASAKGGVGKSTVAAAIARELSRRGFATGLLDTDIHGPSLPSLFGIHRPEMHQDADNLLIPLEDRGLKLMSFGFLLPEGPAILRGPMVSSYLQQLLGQVRWGELEYLVLDLPPGTGDVQLTLTQSVRLSGAVIVTTRQALSLVDVERGIEMFEKVKVPMLGIVENMAWFVCDNCDKKHYLFGGDEGAASLTEKYGLETLATLPLSPALAASIGAEKSDPLVAGMVDAMIRAGGRLSADTAAPPRVDKDEKGLTVTWPEGGTSFVAHRRLRAACRCATCVDEHTGERILRDEDIPADITALEVESLGHYALRVSWSDGHNTGIYPWSQIKKLAGE